MSGRDHDQVSAFFPSIDRNLIMDLDRHLRGATAQPPATKEAAVPDPAPLAVPTLPPRSVLRPDVSHVLEAVELAAQSIATMTARIEELEAHVANVEGENGHLNEQLAEAHRAIGDFEARVRSDGERIARVEALAAQQAGRAATLDRELNAAHGDLARITDAIAATLGFPHQRAE